MAFFSQDWVQELLLKVDLADLIGEYVTLQNKSGRLWALCPFHHEKTPSFSVNTDKNFYYCFGCGKGGNAIHFVMEEEKMTFPEACTYLAEKSGVELPENTQNTRYMERKAEREKIIALNKEAAHHFFQLLYTDAGHAARQYLYNRGINDHAIKTFGLGYADPSWDNLLGMLESKGYKKNDMQKAGLIRIKEQNSYDAFRNRLMIPIINTFSDVIGFGGRVLDVDDIPKYLNSPETAAFSKSKSLYNLNLVRQQKNIKHFILVEGYMDVIALHMYGIRNSVATLGTALTNDQARLIKRYVQTVYVSYDGDDAGRKATLRALDIVEDVGLEGRAIVIPDGKDPDDYIQQEGKEEYMKLVKNALPAMDFRFDMAAEPYDLTDSYQREKYTQDCIRILKKEKSAVVREKYIANLSKRTGFSEHSIMQDLGLQKQSVPPTYRPKKKRANEKDVTVGIKAEKSLISLLATYPDRIEMVEKFLAVEELATPLNRKIYSFLQKRNKEGLEPTIGEILSILEKDEVDQAVALFERDVEKREEIVKVDNFIIDSIKRIKLRNKEMEKEIVLKQLADEKDESKKKSLNKLLRKIDMEHYQLRQRVMGKDG